MVFQSYALYPHMTVRENMGFGLKMSKVPSNEIDKKVNEALKFFILEEYLDRKPKDSFWRAKTKSSNWKINC